ncbi:MAG: hypothetical protein AB7H86_14460 [Blastocatellales bacterium]
MKKLEKFDARFETRLKLPCFVAIFGEYCQDDGREQQGMKNEAWKQDQLQ